MRKNHLLHALLLNTSLISVASANVIIPDLIAIYGLSGIICFIPITIVEAILLQRLLLHNKAIKKSPRYCQTFLYVITANIASTLIGFFSLTNITTYDQLTLALSLAFLASFLIEAPILIFFLKKWTKKKLVWTSFQYSFLMNISSYTILGIVICL